MSLSLQHFPLSSVILRSVRYFSIFLYKNANSTQVMCCWYFVPICLIWGFNRTPYHLFNFRCWSVGFGFAVTIFFCFYDRIWGDSKLLPCHHYLPRVSSYLEFLNILLLHLLEIREQNHLLIFFIQFWGLWLYKVTHNCYFHSHIFRPCMSKIRCMLQLYFFLWVKT